MFFVCLFVFLLKSLYDTYRTGIIYSTVNLYAIVHIMYYIYILYKEILSEC